MEKAKPMSATALIPGKCCPRGGGLIGKQEAKKDRRRGCKIGGLKNKRIERKRKERLIIVDCVPGDLPGYLLAR